MANIMLTGAASRDTAIRAINEDGVRRFFNKPCDVVRGRNVGQAPRAGRREIHILVLVR
ncbi:MAG: hypothetical protein ACOY3P_17280 [Planctomycetota bacterium]